MKFVYIAAGIVGGLTALNFAVANVPQLYNSNAFTSLNANLQKLNPLYYVGLVAVPAIPAT